MNTHGCLDSNNPYLNNSNATEIFPSSQETNKGRLYIRQSYAESCKVEVVKIKALRRLMKIIQGVALTIFSCFIALAFGLVLTKSLEKHIIKLTAKLLQKIILKVFLRK